MKKKLLFLPAALVVGSAFASAAQIFGTDVTLDTAPVLTMAGIIVAAIASIWAVKKVIALSNKS